MIKEVNNKLWSEVYVKIRQTIIEKGMSTDVVDWSVCIGLMSDLYDAPKLKSDLYDAPKLKSDLYDAPKLK